MKKAVATVAVVGAIAGAAVLALNKAPQTQLLGADVESQLKFMNFVARTGKNYKSQEELQYRFQVFQGNMQKALLLNTQEGSNNYGATTFADLTEDEFNAYVRRGIRGMPSVEEAKQLVDEKVNELTRNMEPHAERLLEGAQDKLSTASWSVDWRPKGPAVQNQEQCGSCWAFSTCNGLGYMYAIKGCVSQGTACDEQLLVDCTCSGCNGGW